MYICSGKKRDMPSCRESTAGRRIEGNKTKPLCLLDRLVIVGAYISCLQARSSLESIMVAAEAKRARSSKPFV